MQRIGVILLALLLTSGHAAGLQILAWMSMFADRIETAPSVTAAFISTIDGSKPCALCRAADELAQDEQSGAITYKQLKFGKKGDVGLIGRVWLVLPVAVQVDALSDGQLATFVSYIPDLELPPPRS